MAGRRFTTPLLVSALMLLPMLYVGSYFGMVTPNRLETYLPLANKDGFRNIRFSHRVNYCFGEEWAAIFYWPLEQGDRKLFPERWALRPLPIYDPPFKLDLPPT